MGAPEERMIINSYSSFNSHKYCGLDDVREQQFRAKANNTG